MSGYWWGAIGLAALVFLAIIASVPTPGRSAREARFDDREESGFDPTAADFPLERDGHGADRPTTEPERDRDAGRWSWDEPR